MSLLKTALFKKLALAIFLVILSGFIIFFIFNKEKSQTLRKLKIDGTTINVEIAANHNQKRRGLSERNYLPEKQGMLFAHDEPQIINIWMKDMRFAIDIIWIDENFKIIYIAADVQPDSFPKIFSSPRPAQYVLEVNAGFAKKNNIKIDDKIELQ